MLRKNGICIFLFLQVSLLIFPDSVFRNVILDFDSDVVDFRESGLMENIRGGELVQFSPLDLKVGSIFIDVDGIAKKVARISKVGNEVIIDTIQPELREVFAFYHIPEQKVRITNENLVVDSLQNYNENNRYSYEWGGELHKNFIVQDILNVSVDAKCNVFAEIKTGAALPYTHIDKKGTWKPWKWEAKHVKGYAQGTFNYDLNFSGSVNINARKAWESGEVPLGNYQVSYGVVAGAQLLTKTTVDGKVSISDTLEVRLNGEFGARCDLEGVGVLCFPANGYAWGKTGFSVKNVLSTQNADVSLKQALYLGLYVELVGFVIVEGTTGTGPSLEINGTLDNINSHYSYDFFSKTETITNEGTPRGNGKIGVFLNVDASALNGKWDAGLEDQDREFPIWTFLKDESSALLLENSPSGLEEYKFSSP